MRCADARLYASRRGREQQQQHAVQRPPGPGPRAGADGGGLVDEIDASVIVTDMAGQVMSWNSGAESLYGWSSEEAVGRNARELMVPEDARAAEQLVVELSRDGRWDGELLVRRKDGSLFTAYVRNRLVLDEHHSPVAIVGVAVDISARVAAEEELLQSRNYAQAVAECIGEGMLTFDVDGLLTFVNQTAEKLLGWRAEELRGRPVDTLLAASGARWRDGELPRPPRWRGPQRFDDRARRGRAVPDARRQRAAGRLHGRSFRTDDGSRAAWSCSATSASASAENRSSGATPTLWRRLDRVESAIAEDRLVLYAQPIIDLRTGRTVQHELLLRMRNATASRRPPASSCRWPRTTPDRRHGLVGIKQATQIAGSGCPVHLNISARSVVDPDFLAHIERCIAQYEVAPGLLVFEITETAIVEDEQAVRMFAEGLHALGCEVALDDFGTGYGTPHLSQADTRRLPQARHRIRSRPHDQQRERPRRPGDRRARARLRRADGRRGRRGGRHAEDPLPTRRRPRAGLPHRATSALLADARRSRRAGADRRARDQTSDATQPGSAQAQAGAAAAASELYLGAFAEADFARIARNAPCSRGARLLRDRDSNPKFLLQRQACCQLHHPGSSAQG